MSDLQPITPLGALEPRIDLQGPVTLTEVVDTALASVAARLGKDAEASAALAKFTGVPCPAAGTAAFGTLSAYWMGPSQWMVLAPMDTYELLASQLENTLSEVASVTEQTDGWCRFDLTGAGLAGVIERLCPFDIHAAQGGEATRTSIDHLGCYVLCKDPGHLIVIGPRSSAGSLHRALLIAMCSAH